MLFCAMHVFSFIFFFCKPRGRVIIRGENECVRSHAWAFMLTACCTYGCLPPNVSVCHIRYTDMYAHMQRVHLGHVHTQRILSCVCSGSSRPNVRCVLDTYVSGVYECVCAALVRTSLMFQFMFCYTVGTHGGLRNLTAPYYCAR